MNVKYSIKRLSFLQAVISSEVLIIHLPFSLISRLRLKYNHLDTNKNESRCIINNE